MIDQSYYSAQMLKFCLRSHFLAKKEASANALACNQVLNQPCLFENKRADGTKSDGNKKTRAKTDRRMEEGSRQGSDQGDRHKEQHTTTERKANRKPGTLLEENADQGKDRDKDRHQEDLCEHTHDEIYGAETVKAEGKAGNRAAKHRADEIGNQHQRSAKGAHEGLGDDVVALFRANGKEIFGVAAPKIIRNKDTNENAHRHKCHIDITHGEDIRTA